MRRLACILAASVLLGAGPADAVILQDPVNAAPEDGEAWEFRGAWQAFAEDVFDNEKRAACSPLLVSDPRCANFVTTRSLYVVEGRGRWRLGEGTGFELHVPAMFVLQDDAGDFLPPGVPPQALGLGDLRLVLARDLLRDSYRGLVTRLRANLPPNPSPLGLQTVNCVQRDGQGNIITGPDGREIALTSRIEWAAPSVDLRMVGHQDIPEADLQLVGSLGANVPFRRQVTDTLVQWRGLAFEGGAGVTWRPLRLAAFHLEALGFWSNPFEEDRRVLCETGGQRIDLAPGVTFRVVEGIDVWGVVRVPAYYGGYWREWSSYDLILGVRTASWQP